MTDFDAAVRVGMGIRLRLTPQQAQGFDFLLVFGTKAAVNLPTAPPSSSRCSTRTTIRTDSDSRCKARQRTTPRTAPRDSTTADRDSEQSYQYERVGPTFRAGDTSNADVLTAALGLRGSDAAVLANLRNANVREQLDARHMNRALWPATWEYFFTQHDRRGVQRCPRGMGAEPLRRARSRVRAAADAPCRQATLRRPPSNVAESLEIIRADRGGPQPRSRDSRTSCSGCGASGMGSSPVFHASAGSPITLTRTSPTSSAWTACRRAM